MKTIVALTFFGLMAVIMAAPKPEASPGVGVVPVEYNGYQVHNYGYPYPYFYNGYPYSAGVYPYNYGAEYPIHYVV